MLEDERFNLDSYLPKRARTSKIAKTNKFMKLFIGHVKQKKICHISRVPPYARYPLFILCALRLRQLEPGELKDSLEEYFFQNFPSRFQQVLDIAINENIVDSEDDQYIREYFGVSYLQGCLISVINRELRNVEIPAISWTLGDLKNPSHDIVPLCSFSLYYQSMDIIGIFSRRSAVLRVLIDNSFFQVKGDLSKRYCTNYDTQKLTVQFEYVNLKFIPPMFRNINPINGDIDSEFSLSDPLELVRRIYQVNELNATQLEQDLSEISEQEPLQELSSPSTVEMIKCYETEDSFCEAFSDRSAKLKFKDRTIVRLDFRKAEARLLTNRGEMIMVSVANPGVYAFYIKRAVEFHDYVFKDPIQKMKEIEERERYKHQYLSLINQNDELLSLLQGDSYYRETPSYQFESMEEPRHAFEGFTDIDTQMSISRNSHSLEFGAQYEDSQEMDHRLEEVSERSSRLLEKIEQLLK